MSTWSTQEGWWLQELASDAAYEQVVTPLLMEVLEPSPDHIYLDLGCGEGRVMRSLISLGASTYGLDINEKLVSRAGKYGVVADLRALPIRANSVDGIYMVLVLEHISDHRAVLAEAARLTKPGGVLALVANHPVWTAPNSTPITDAEGEVLWRPGDYFGAGISEIPVPEGTIVFNHRSMSELLNSAAAAGWSLQKMIERPHHDLEDQGGIPRLVACQWRLIRHISVESWSD